jgi:hypothetical protein
MVKVKIYVVKHEGGSMMFKTKFYTNTMYTYGIWTIVGVTNIVFINSLTREVPIHKRIEKWCK